MSLHILIAGCGDLGMALGQLLLTDHHQVTGLKRSPPISPSSLSFISGDVTHAETLHSLAALKIDILVYCVAASAQTDDNYRAHYVDGLRNMLIALETSQLKHVFFVSSTRVYGQHTNEILDETSPAIAADFGGNRLLEAEALLKTTNCPSTVLRLSGIYGPGRNRMIDLAGRPEAWPAQNSWTNRIHRNDAARFIAFLIEQITSGSTPDRLYLVTDSKPVPQYEVLMWIAQLQWDISANGSSKTPSSGKRLSNRKLLSTGFQLSYPDFQAGYLPLLNTI